MEFFNKHAPNLFPKKEEGHKNEESESLSRRSFLKVGAAATAGILSNDIFAAEFQAANKTDLESIKNLLNGHELTHDKADNKRIFNNQRILIEKYKEKDFEYYKPKEVDTKFKKDLLARAKSFNKNIKNYDEALKDNNYEVVQTASDFVIVAEIEGAGKNDSLYANGMAIIEKGTKIARVKSGEKNSLSKDIYKNFIYKCFNPIYAIACPPMMKK